MGSESGAHYSGGGSARKAAERRRCAALVREDLLGALGDARVEGRDEQTLDRHELGQSFLLGLLRALVQALRATRALRGPYALVSAAVRIPRTEYA